MGDSNTIKNVSEYDSSGNGMAAVLSKPNISNKTGCTPLKNVSSRANLNPDLNRKKEIKGILKYSLIVSFSMRHLLFFIKFFSCFEIFMYRFLDFYHTRNLSTIAPSYSRASNISYDQGV